MQTISMLNIENGILESILQEESSWQSLPLGINALSVDQISLPQVLADPFTHMTF